MTPALKDTEAVLRARDLSVTITDGDNPRRIVDSVSLSLHRRDMVALRGPSGSGKTTLLQVLALLRRPDSGNVEILGTAPSWTNRPLLTRLRLQHIGFLPQQSALILSDTIGNNLSLPLLYQSPRISSRERRRMASESLSSVGLDGVGLRRKAKTLSGGERQRVALARALMTQADIILADEPSASLDHQSTLAIADLLRSLAAEGRAVVVATHDPLLADACDRTVELQQGKLVTTDPSDSE